MKLKGQSILSISQFERDDIDNIFCVADDMEPYAQRQKRTRVLEGAILGNMFFEASTRTRISFGSAFNLLGGDVRETVGLELSALSKGESLHDFNTIMKDFYFTVPVQNRPRVIAMTASPGGAMSIPQTRRAVHELCFNLVS